jgi:hypothetical protein
MYNALYQFLLSENTNVLEKKETKPSVKFMLNVSTKSRIGQTQHTQNRSILFVNPRSDAINAQDPLLLLWDMLRCAMII